MKPIGFALNIIIEGIVKPRLDQFNILKQGLQYVS